MRQKAVDGLAVGDTFVVTRTFTEQDTVMFAAISKDYNPVHFDRRFANSKGFVDVICHGLLVASMLTEVGGQIGWPASGMTFRFKKPVYFGDTIECRLTITQIDDRGRAQAEAAFRNQQKEIAIEASVTGIVPGIADRKIMSLMVAEGDPTNPRRRAGS